MKLGILMAGTYGLSPPTDGRRVQIQKQADALERIGHEVVRLNPWESYPLETFDAIHLVQGGLGNIAGISGPIPGVRKMGLATFLDTTCSNWLYRLSTLAGRFDHRFSTNQSLIWRQARACDLIIARNRDEKRLLVPGIGISEHKVKIVLNGVDPPIPVEPSKVREELGIQSDFLFHVSTFADPRKNVLRLIQAANMLDLPLVIAGTAGDRAATETIHQAAKGNEKIRFLGRLPIRQRDSLYAACRVFCLPSLYEGTGLVALEAASYGTNVVITERGGPRDYFAEYADYVNPDSVESIRGAIEQAWNKPRNDLLRTHVLTNLSWEASARALARAYGC